MTLNVVELSLHPFGHECASRVVECSFGKSVWGTLDGHDITFAEGLGQYSGALLAVKGRLSDSDFRTLGRYMVALAHQSPPCYHRDALGQQVIYPCRSKGRLSMPSVYEALFKGDVTLVTIRDGLYI